MKWLRPIGLVLVATLSLVHSMPTETTTTTPSRYTYEGYDRFSLDTIRNLNKNTFLNSLLFENSHFLDPLNFSGITDRHRRTKQLKNNEIYFVTSSTDDKFNDSLEEGRKLVRKPSKNVLSHNVIKNNTIKVTTANNLPLKIIRNTHITGSHKSRTPVVPNKRNTSSVLINNKNRVNVVNTKDPFKIRVNKLTTKTAPKIKYTSSTLAPILIKLTRLTTQRPKISTVKQIIVKTSPSGTRLSVGTTPKRKKKRPTVHKIVTKWSDDLSEIKQNWYEEGVPYPNPNPEISSFSPPVSLNQFSSLAPLSSNIIESVNYPSLNPEITSYSPSVFLNSASPSSDFLNNFNYPTPNPEVTSYSPPVSLNDISPISPIGDAVSSFNYPSPNPEVTSYSPPISLSDLNSISPSSNNGIPPISSYSTPSSTTAVSNPFNVFNLDMVPDRTKDAAGGLSPCPSVHISSSVLGRQQRQDCSDLNLVINSHFHQNQNSGGTRNPTVSTYDSPGEDPARPVEDIPLEEEGLALDGAGLADPGTVGSGVANQGVAADPGVGNAGGLPQAAAPQAASPPAAGTGGTGGSGGEGGAGDDGGGIKFPDLKPLFELIGYLWDKLGHLLSFLKNPYLYIIPMALFFALGFFTILALFPWWIPLLLLYLGIKSHKKPKETVSFYKHVHHPVRHPDGWFWNHQTKTWQNLQDFVHKRNDVSDKRTDDISQLIKNFRNKYNNGTTVHTWKRRRRAK